MKRSGDFLLQDVAGSLVIVPVGNAANDFLGMMNLNATGAYLWQLLEQEQTEQSLVDALLQRYDVDSQTAQKDVQRFLEKLQEAGALV